VKALSTSPELVLLKHYFKPYKTGDLCLWLTENGHYRSHSAEFLMNFRTRARWWRKQNRAPGDFTV